MAAQQIDPQKIVRHKELREISKRLLAENLTLREKFILNAYDRPVSAWHGLRLGVKLAFNERARDERASQSPDGTLGIYHDSTKAGGAEYVRADLYLREVEASLQQMRLFPETIRKIADLQRQAVAEARDYRPELNGGKIKPFIVPKRKR